MISIYILTYNEQLDIGPCLDSALDAGADDIIVVDSFSRDRTPEIVKHYSQSHPVRLVQHAFESHGRQRTWMLREVPAKYSWIYILEADERMTPALFEECRQTIQTLGQTLGQTPAPTPEPVGFYAAERVMFMGQWIRRSTQYPRYQLRLLRPDRVWFDDYGHTEREVCDGPTGFLQETYPHYTSGKGLSRWIEKHNRYSTDEAIETLRQLQSGEVDWSALFWGKTEVERRRALKNLSLRLPFRPVVRFIYMYILLGGCWDGRAGLRWCLLQAFYEYLIVLKTWELQNRPYDSVYGDTPYGLPRLESPLPSPPAMPPDASASSSDQIQATG